MNHPVESAGVPLPEGSLWSRLRTTPLRDVLRGRLTASLDLRRAIAAATLPDPLAVLTYSVARRTRLSRAEQIDVARELADHFSDGIHHGRSAEQLTESFGDQRQAARLIRRAKLRSRPLGWRIYRRTWQAIAILIVLLLASYLFLLARLMLSHPTLAHNYSLEITAFARAVPEVDRGWPSYREALLQLKPAPKEGDQVIDLSSEKPGSENWDLVLAWLRENQTALEQTRKGAMRRHLGFVYDDPGNRVWNEREHLSDVYMDLSANRDMIQLLLPQVQQIRGLADLVAVDAQRAIGEGDRQSLVSDVQSLVGMAQQQFDEMPLLITDLVSLVHFKRALAQIDGALATKPEMLNDNDLRNLAHTIAGFGGGGPLRLHLEGERMCLNDIYQRIYTDDGHGGGHLTRDATRFLRLMQATVSSGSARDSDLTDLISATSLSAIMLSRRPMTELTQQVFDQVAGEWSKPLWERKVSSLEPEMRRWNNSALERARHLPLVIFLPALGSGVSTAAERATQRRDATLVALALQLHHRRHGDWPARLDELVPDLLPAVPPDRFTGKPLQYRLIEGRPLLYSAGPDRDDDGGLRNVDRELIESFSLQGSSETASAPDPDGDWILWPPQPEKEESAANP